MLRADAPPMYAHQLGAMPWLAVHGTYIEGDPMGAGKSRLALADFAALRGHKTDARLLVVAKKDLLGWHKDPSLREQWSKEIETWTTFDYAVASGTAKQREQAIAAGQPITLIAYDNLHRNLHDLNQQGFDYVVYDEAHKLKNRLSLRTNAAFGLRATKRGFLTGSPLLNHVDELWPLLFMCDPARFSNYWSFVNRYAVFGGYQDKQIIGVREDTLAELRAILRLYMIRRPEEVIKKSLPPKRVLVRGVDMVPAQRKMYDKIADELKIEYPDGMIDEIGSPMTRSLRLRQCLATTAHFGGVDESGVLDGAMELLDEIGDDHKVVVVTGHIPAVNSMAHRMAAAGISYVRFTGVEKDAERSENKARFQNVPISDGGPRVLLATYPVVTEGHNLYAASYAIKLDKLYVPKLDEQFEDRLHRPGQKNPVTIYELRCRKSVHQRIERILTGKRNEFDSVIGEDDYEAGLRALTEAGAA